MPASASSATPPRVVVLAASDWRSDSRVVREAEGLARNGFEVVVVFQRNVLAADPDEVHNGVRYVCVPATAVSWRDFFELHRIHRRLLSRDVRGMLRGHLGSVSSLGELLLTPFVGAFGKAGLRLADHFEGWRVAMVYASEPLEYLHRYALRCRARVESLHPDIIHAHDILTLSCAYLASRATGAPYVYDAHELETHTNYWSFNRLTTRAIATYERALIAAAAGVITVSDSIADWLAREYRVRRPTVVLNVPAVLRRPDSAGGGATVRQSLGLARETPLAVYVGSVTIDRGIEQCVEALPHMPVVHLALVGPRHQPLVDAVTRRATELGVASRLHLVDPVAADRVVSFVADADCGVVAIQNTCLSYYYSFPNKLLESVMAGLPVAAADLLEIRRFVEEFKVGVVMDERDPKAIASAVLTIVADRARFAPSDATLDRIAASYGWPVQEGRLVELFRSLGRYSPRASGSSARDLREARREH